MKGWIIGYTDGRTDIQINRPMHGWTDGQTAGWTKYHILSCSVDASKIAVINGCNLEELTDFEVGLRLIWISLIHIMVVYVMFIFGHFHSFSVIFARFSRQTIKMIK